MGGQLGDGAVFVAKNRKLHDYCPAPNLSEDYALYSAGSIYYTQNAGLDLNEDGIVTKYEATQKVVKRMNYYKKSDKYYNVTLVAIICTIIFFVFCSYMRNQTTSNSEKVIKNADDCTDTETHSVGSAENSVKDVNTIPIEPTDKKYEEKLKKYLGSYEFIEYLEPDKMMKYNIVIYKDNGYFAMVFVDGWMTLIRLRTEVIADNYGVKLLVKEILKENKNNYFKKDDVLLELAFNDSILETTWYKMKPMLKENESTTKCFIKTN